MIETTTERVSFADADSRADEMQRTIDAWVEDLAALTDEAQASEAFQAWLDVQSRFHDYSYRNALLIARQCPDATMVAGYRTWQTEFDRQVKRGESAIWIRAPIVARKCPACGNTPPYHDSADCTHDGTSSEEWPKGVVGFRPVSVFDVSQTEGEALPSLETDVTGDAETLVPRLMEAAPTLDVAIEVVSAREWDHGASTGVCLWDAGGDGGPLVQARSGSSRATVAHSLVHEFAHALLHRDVAESGERARREVEAESVAYVVSRYFGLDPGNAAFYLAAWQGEETDAIRNRLGRIRAAAERIIAAVDDPGQAG